METMIGFVVGYFVGTREGRAGFEKARASWEAIRHSAELRQMVGTAVAVATPMIKKLATGGAGAMVGGVVEELASRAAGVESNRTAA